MERTQGRGGGGPRAAGWYPDPRDASRRRYWDGERWSELTAAADAGVASPAEASTGPAVDGPLRPGPRRGLLLVGAAVVVALLGVGAWVLLGGDDPAEDAAATTVATATTIATVTTADPDAADPVPPGPASTETTDTGAPTSTAGVDDPDTAGAPCEADPAALLGLLKAHPPLASFVDGLGIERTRCVGDWSSAVVTSPIADRALALFERDGDGWMLVLLGSAEPCAGLGIPAADEAALGCGEW